MTDVSRAYLCAATRAHADEFIDGELGSRESAGVEAHLLSCGPCRESFQRELDLKLMVRQACACDELPEDLRVQVLARITELRVQPGIATFETLTVRADWSTERD